LVFNLDDDRDHRFRLVEEADEDWANNPMKNLNHSVFNNTESRINEFNFYFINGIISPPTISPNGYLSVWCIDAHVDNVTRENLLTVMYGRGDHVIGQSTNRGFVGHNILITESVWRDHILNTSSNRYSPDVLADLYSKGYEIKLHCIYLTDNISEENCAIYKADSMLYMDTYFRSDSWSDHDYKVSHDALVNGGLDPLSVRGYMKDLWDLYGIKYFHSAPSEDINPSGIDVLNGVSQDKRNPLYWRHPTRINDFILSGQVYRNALNGGVLNEDALNDLIANYGVCVCHLYPCLPNFNFPDQVEEVAGVMVTTESFEAQLSYLAGLRDSKLINITTLSDIMDYWIMMEAVEISSRGGKVIDIKNNNVTDIEGASFRMADSDIIFGDGILYTVDNDDLIYTCNILAGETIRIIAFRDIKYGDTSSSMIETINTNFNSLGAWVDGIYSKINASDKGDYLIGVLNTNITGINEEGIPVNSIQIGMSGSQMITILNNFCKDYILATK
jgi:hypothetical protein